MIVRITRSGGFAGVVEELGRIDTASLDRAVAAKVTAGVEELERTAALRNQAIGADMFRYDIEVEDERGRRKLTLTEEGDPGKPLPQPLDDLLSAIEGPR
jgi:hypothetical protein